MAAVKSKIRFPNVHRMSDGSEFFTAFLALNAKKSAKGTNAFSHRAVAKRLAWPVSLISDLAAGRKVLSVRRAIEFARFAGCDFFATERLIYLALRGEGGPIVREHFDDRLKKMTKVRHPAPARDLPRKISNDLEMWAVFCVLRWAGRLLEPAEIRKVLHTYPDLRDADIERIAAQLIENDIIAVGTRGEIRVLLEDWCLDEDVKPDHGARFRQYGENLVRACGDLRRPYHFSSGFLVLPRGKLPEIAARMQALRDYLRVMQAETINREHTADALAFQFNLNLFTLLDTNLPGFPPPP